MLLKRDCWYNCFITFFSKCIKLWNIGVWCDQWDNLAGGNILWSSSSCCVEGCKAARKWRQTHYSKSFFCLWLTINVWVRVWKIRDQNFDRLRILYPWVHHEIVYCCLIPKFWRFLTSYAWGFVCFMFVYHLYGLWDM